MRSLFSSSLIALSAIASALADFHGIRRHHDSNAIARRVKGEMNLHKRYDGARFTYYDVGLGACGQYNVPSDFIVALNTPQFGGGYPGPNCFKSITMTYGGKTTTAVIMDECPGCPMYGLDLSRGLFDFFASESLGVLYGTWYFNDGSGTTTTYQWTTTTSTWNPPPTTTWTSSDTPLLSFSMTWSAWSPSYSPSSIQTSTSSSYTPSSSPSSTSLSSTSLSSPSSTSSSSSYAVTNDYSSGAGSGLAIPTGFPSNNQPHIILSLNEALIDLGALIVEGHKI